MSIDFIYLAQYWQKQPEMEKQLIFLFITFFCIMNVSVCRGFKIMTTPPIVKTTNTQASTESNLEKGYLNNDFHQNDDHAHRTEENANDDEKRYLRFPIQKLVQLLIRECTKLLSLLQEYLSRMSSDDSNTSSSVRQYAQEAGSAPQAQDDEMAMKDVTTKRVIFTNDVRVKRSTASEFPREGSSVNLSSESSTLKNSTLGTTQAPSKNKKSQSELQTESLISSNTPQKHYGSLLPTTTLATTTTTIQSNKNVNDTRCPLKLYSGNDSNIKLYGLLKKPCGSYGLHELDQDRRRDLVQAVVEYIYKINVSTNKLLNNISEKIKDNQKLVDALKKEDFECFLSDSVQENETSVEEQTLEIHHSLLKSYAILDLMIIKANETEAGTSSYRAFDQFIIAEVSNIMKNIRISVCGIENLLGNKGYGMETFPLFSERDNVVSFFRNNIELSSNFFMYINQVFRYLNKSAINETKVLWSFVQ